MGKEQLISVTLDADRISDLDRVAEELGCSREEAVATAIMRFLNDEAPVDELWRSIAEPPPPAGLEMLDDAANALRAFIQEGIEAADRGDVVDHKDLIAELRRSGRKHAA